MSFEILPLTLDDVPELAELDDMAMKAWPMAQAMELEAQRKGSTRKAIIVKWMGIGLQNPDPNSVWLKVRDSKTGEMIAAANWGIHLEPEPVKPKEEVPAPATAVADKVQAEKSIMQATSERWQEFKKEFVGEQPYYYLRVLVTAVQHQRKGAGSMLIRWGCEKADEKQVISVLRASPAGYGLYLKHGFGIVREEDFDVRPWGVDAVEISRYMVRKPQSKKV